MSCRRYASVYFPEFPRIRAYNGAGPLEQWIKVVAIRTAIDLHRTDQSIPRIEGAWLETLLRRRRGRVLADDEGRIQARAGGGDPGPGRELSPRDRAILRLHVVEGVSIEKIAASYGVHRVTVARWVWTAGETLLDGLRARFQEKFGIVPPRVRQHGAHGAESAFDRSGGVAGGYQPRRSTSSLQTRHLPTWCEDFERNIHRRYEQPPPAGGGCVFRQRSLADLS